MIFSNRTSYFIPEDAIANSDEQHDEAVEKQETDERISIRASENCVINEPEFSDSEDEGEVGRHDCSTQRPRVKKSKTNSPTLTRTTSHEDEADNINDTQANSASIFRGAGETERTRGDSNDGFKLRSMKTTRWMEH